MGSAIRFVFLVGFSFSIGIFGAGPRDASTSFIFFGDSGRGDANQYLVAGGLKEFCKTSRCDFVALLGDNFYPSGVASVNDPQWNSKWWDPYKALNLIFYATLGNHDYGGNIDAQIAYSDRHKHWIMPGRYYDFQQGNTDFFVIDTQKFEPAQVTWLNDKLNKSTATWKIVYGHHPIYSYGLHGHTDTLIKNLLPILRGKADYYLCGHDHDKQVLEVAGEPLYVVSGASSETRSVKKGSKSIFASATLGFSHLEMNEQASTLRMLDAKGATQFEKTIPARKKVLF